MRSWTQVVAGVLAFLLFTGFTGLAISTVNKVAFIGTWLLVMSIMGGILLTLALAIYAVDGHR